MEQYPSVHDTEGQENPSVGDYAAIMGIVAGMGGVFYVVGNFIGEKIHGR